MDDMTKLEMFGVLALVAFAAYSSYKTAGLIGKGVTTVNQAAQDAWNGTVRAANDLGNTVQNTADNARLSMSDFLFDNFGPRYTADPSLNSNGKVQPSPSQAMLQYMSGAAPAYVDYYDGWNTGADDFTDAAQRVAKPGYGDLAQPPSDYYDGTAP